MIVTNNFLNPAITEWNTSYNTVSDINETYDCCNRVEACVTSIETRQPGASVPSDHALDTVDFSTQHLYLLIPKNLLWILLFASGEDILQWIQAKLIKES